MAPAFTPPVLVTGTMPRMARARSGGRIKQCTASFLSSAWPSDGTDCWTRRGLLALGVGKKIALMIGFRTRKKKSKYTINDNPILDTMFVLSSPFLLRFFFHIYTKYLNNSFAVVLVFLLSLNDGNISRQAGDGLKL